MTFIADPLVEKVIGCAIAVHREMGPGLLEPIYSKCMCIELDANRIRYRTQVAVPLTYRGLRLDGSYRIDLLVEDRLVIEVKAVQELASVHIAQVLTYLRLIDARQGLLINFNAARLKDGLKSVIRRDSSWPSVPPTDPEVPS